MGIQIEDNLHIADNKGNGRRNPGRTPGGNPRGNPGGDGNDRDGSDNPCRGRDDGGDAPSASQRPVDPWRSSQVANGFSLPHMDAPRFMLKA